MSLLIKNLTRSPLPIPVSKIEKAKKQILGETYELSVVLIGEKKSAQLNSEYRKKDKSTNVLSFPLNKKEGEIFLTPNKIKKEIKKFDMNYQKLFLFLFIHGCLHLKGYDHGPKMEKLEQKFLANLI